MRFLFLNGIKTYSPKSVNELINFALSKKKILVAINAEKILKLDSNIKLHINQHIGYPDGIGAVMALKRKGFKNSFKIPGCELWLEIIKHNFKSKSFYFIGSDKPTINKTIKKIRIKFPGINILNFRDGYFDKKERLKLIDDVVSLSPDIIFVAMGSPAQEKLMFDLHEKHKALYQGLGGSFDIFIGNKHRAPKWWLNNNLEWLYRLINQPARISRQIIYLPFL